MTVSLNGTSGIVFNDASTQNTSAFTGGFAFRNRIINGAMVISQRNGTAAVTPTADATYTLDRWGTRLSQASKFSVQQTTTAPTNFYNSLKATSTSAYTVGTSEFFGVYQNIEGFNISDLNWGTANALTVTISFQVYSSLTGTFGGSIFNASGSQSYPFSYSIPVANTWTTITLTIAGATSGSWNAGTNSTGISVFFSLGAGATVSGAANAWSGTLYRSATGATSVVGTNGATFYITGVQLEKGSTATSFDYRPYGTELALCQRYYYRLNAPSATNRYGSGFNNSTTQAYICFNLPTSMRTAPTALEQSGTAGNYSVGIVADGAVTCSSVPTFSTATTENTRVSFPVASGLTAGQGCNFRAVNTSAYLAWSAEL